MEVGPDSGVRTRSPGLGQRAVDLEVGSAGATKPWGGRGLEQKSHLPGSRQGEQWERAEPRSRARFLFLLGVSLLVYLGRLATDLSSYFGIEIADLKKIKIKIKKTG